MTTTAPANIAKAYLELFDRPTATAAVTVVTSGVGRQVSFQFNPKEIQLQKKANWTSKSTRGNKDAPPAEYNGPEPSSLTLEIFLDAGEKTGGDVSAEVQKLFDACVPTSSSNSKNKPLPPFVKFAWGNPQKPYFVGYMESVSAKYTLFRQDGKPVRAICTVTLKELPKSEAKQNPTSGALSAMRSVQTVEGDSLAGLAYQEHGDPTQWRSIAEANGIDDPLRIFPGTNLLIPSSLADDQGGEVRR